MTKRKLTYLLLNRAIFVAVGWICFAYLVYKVTTVKIEIDVWDPYEVLGISEVNTVTLNNLEIIYVLKHYNFYNL